MATKAPPRGALCGRSYLEEVTAIDLIVALRDSHKLLNELLGLVSPRSGMAGRITRAISATVRVVRELEDALGSSADE